jgi:hypothetical protein
MLVANTIVSAESQRKAFESAWIGRHVIVRQPLYSLVYKERQRLRDSVNVKRDGLTVVTPFEGTYFQFDGRRQVDDVMVRDVSKITGAVKTAYLQSQFLDDGLSQVIDPVSLTRYDPGMELTIRAARVTRETVRIELSLAADDETLTCLTVQWPVPLSKSFAERGNVESLIQQFLTVADARSR